MTSPWTDGRATAAPKDDRLPWRSLLLRFLVLVPPAQLIGILLGGGLIAAAHLGPSVASFGIGISGGVVAGLAVGLLVRPLGRLRPYLLLCAVFAAGTTAVFFVVNAAMVARQTAEGPGWWRYLVGVVLITVVQTVVAAGVWVARTRPTTGA